MSNAAKKKRFLMRYDQELLIYIKHQRNSPVDNQPINGDIGTGATNKQP